LPGGIQIKVKTFEPINRTAIIALSMISGKNWIAIIGNRSGFII
jgi:hypothetical protein